MLGWLDAFAAAPDARRFYLCRLVPPRATFMQDMTADELAMMKAHAEYWRPLHAAGVMIAYGPVADPRGGFGCAITAARDDAELAALQAEDPAIKAGRGMRYDNAPFARLIY